MATADVAEGTYVRERRPRRVVITGIGLITPVGQDLGTVFTSLLSGRSGVGPITRYDAGGHRVRIAGEVDDFSATDWVDGKEARRLDRAAAFALAAAELAVRDRGTTADRGQTIGTVVATGIGGITSNHKAHAQYLEHGAWKVAPYMVPMSLPNMGAALVAARFGFRGPCVCPVAACAASADAVGTAFRMVRDGYVDACLAGGTEACLTPAVVAGFANMGALSRRNDDPVTASRPFDAERDGFVMAEGAAMVFLEGLDAASASGRRPYAEVVGYGQSCDAHHMTTPMPDGSAAAAAMGAALDEAGLRPGDVDYVNAHGTGTAANDAAETAAIKQAFGRHAAALAVSSTKSMTGHLLGAAGALEIAVSALVVGQGRVPPTINYAHPDPACDLDYVPNVARDREVAVALSNSMGFGGHNTAVIVADPEAGRSGARAR